MVLLIVNLLNFPSVNGKRHKSRHILKPNKHCEEPPNLVSLTLLHGTILGLMIRYFQKDILAEWMRESLETGTIEDVDEDWSPPVEEPKICSR